MTQESLLFDLVNPEPDPVPAPWAYGSETSKAAAEEIGQHLGRLEQLVLDAIVAHGPQTCDELEQRTGLSHQTTSARLRGLKLRDRIRATGERRPTRTGRMADVWGLAMSNDMAEGVAEARSDTQGASTGACTLPAVACLVPAQVSAAHRGREVA